MHLGEIIKKNLDLYWFFVVALGMREKEKTMKSNDAKIFEMATKQVLPFETIEVKKLTYTKPKFVETSRVLTYKPTGEKYKVMKVVDGYFENKVVDEFKNMSLDWKNDDVFDKLIWSELKKNENNA